MQDNVVLRLATVLDAEEMLEIYAPYVSYTTVSFEYVPPTLDEFRERIVANTAKFPWIVCVIAGEIAGYAYASAHAARAAYQWTCDVSVYVKEKYHRMGIASALYDALFTILKRQRIHIAYACVTLPNIRSLMFHKAIGFNEVAVFKNAGFKFGKWHGVQWLERVLLAPSSPPKKLLTTYELNMSEIEKIFHESKRHLQHLDKR